MYNITHNIHGTLAQGITSTNALLDWFKQADLPKPNNIKMLKHLNSFSKFSYAADTITISKIN